MLIKIEVKNAQVKTFYRTMPIVPRVHEKLIEGNLSLRVIDVVYELSDTQETRVKLITKIETDTKGDMSF